MKRLSLTLLIVMFLGFTDLIHASEIYITGKIESHAFTTVVLPPGVGSTINWLSVIDGYLRMGTVRAASFATDTVVYMQGSDSTVVGMGLTTFRTLINAGFLVLSDTSSMLSGYQRKSNPVTVAGQPNITSLGTLNNLTVVGNQKISGILSAGGITTTGSVTVSGNVLATGSIVTATSLVMNFGSNINLYNPLGNSGISIVNQGTSGLSAMVYGNGLTSTTHSMVGTLSTTNMDVAGAITGKSITLAPSVGSNGVVTTVSGTAIGWLSNVASTSDYGAWFQVGGTKAGDITFPTSSTTMYGTSCDRRLKKQIKPLTGSLRRIGMLKPSNWVWIADGKYGEGFVADELQKVIPGAVSGRPNEVDDLGKPKYQTVDYSKIVVDIVGAIQEQQKEIDLLRADNKKMLEKLKHLAKLIKK